MNRHTTRAFTTTALFPALLVPALNRALGQTSPAAGGGGGASIASRTQGMERQDGFIPFYVDTRTGKVLLEIPRDSTRSLFWVSQATGLGSNPIGIDRGAGGPEQVARFDRDGERVLLVFENWSYRGAADNPSHQRTVA